MNQTPGSTLQAPVETSSAPSSPRSQTSPPLAPVTPSTAQARIDACALLTSKEIQSVQGEAVKETKLSGQAQGGFHVSQCFFTLPTFTNSVSLLVSQKGEGAGAHDPKEFWQSTFHEEKDRVRDKKRGEEEEKESAPPKKVTGIGDEAFWIGSRVGGALYVLKGNVYVRISIGGPPDQAAKLRKSKTLAQKVIARL
jgi:hypothetical protein